MSATIRTVGDMKRILASVPDDWELLIYLEGAPATHSMWTIRRVRKEQDDLPTVVIQVGERRIKSAQSELEVIERSIRYGLCHPEEGDLLKKKIVSGEVNYGDGESLY